MKKTIIILQARTGSQRYPKKVLAKIEGKPMIWHIINRLKKVKNAEKTILATTNFHEDDKLVKIASNNGISFFRGPKNNVLKRFFQCALIFEAHTIIRITGDCPLVDPKLIDEMISFFNLHNFDYVSNTIEPTFPDGLDIEIFSFSTLEKLLKKSKLKSEKEHVTSYILNHKKEFKIYNYENKINLSHIRLTVDEKQDIKLIRKIYSQMKPLLIFSSTRVLKLLKNQPQLLEINKNLKRNQGYINSLRRVHH